MLKMIPPNGVISPTYLSTNLNIDNEIIIKLLTLLSERDVIKTQFILKCTNDDEDMIHKFQFETNNELLDFVRINGKSCPECDEKLNTFDIKVFFKVKNQSSWMDRK